MRRKRRGRILERFGTISNATIQEVGGAGDKTPGGVWGMEGKKAEFRAETEGKDVSADGEMVDGQIWVRKKRVRRERVWG